MTVMQKVGYSYYHCVKLLFYIKTEIHKTIPKKPNFHFIESQMKSPGCATRWGQKLNRCSPGGVAECFVLQIKRIHFC